MTWAIFIQKDTDFIIKLEALIIMLFATVLPAVICLINAFLFTKISKENSLTNKSKNQLLEQKI